ncbi:ABC transporter substrate-binding protein [Paenibacillus filicis]|uniref:ABC transporter substrate-binding protein n=1 Tax=Paenibacillus filicis TaxID=669464 RepID=A0ABU9DJC3_9BACL
MKKRWMFLGSMVLFLLLMTACGGNKQQAPVSNGASNSGQSASQLEKKGANDAKEEKKDQAASETRTIEYLGQSYTVPKHVEKIVITGAMEAMEDAASLDVHPIGAISIGGKFPEIFASITVKSESIGEKIQPNLEKILQLKPDVILGSTKFKKDVHEKLQKIAPTILVSHISTDWEANLQLMGKLSGKEAKAEQIIAKYKADSQAAKSTLQEKLKGKTVAAIRIRSTQTYVYPKDVYFNPVLYDEIGLDVPEAVKKARTQEVISVEQLAEMNPDYLFIQFSTSENSETQSAYEELKKNAIFQNIAAVKNGHLFMNVVDPLLEGGPAFSRAIFLETIMKQLKQN